MSASSWCMYPWPRSWWPPRRVPCSAQRAVWRESRRSLLPWTGTPTARALLGGSGCGSRVWPVVPAPGLWHELWLVAPCEFVLSAADGWDFLSSLLCPPPSPCSSSFSLYLISPSFFFLFRFSIKAQTALQTTLHYVVRWNCGRETRTSGHMIYVHYWPKVCVLCAVCVCMTAGAAYGSTAGAPSSLRSINVYVCRALCMMLDHAHTFLWEPMAVWPGTSHHWFYTRNKSLVLALRIWVGSPVRWPELFGLCQAEGRVSCSGACSICIYLYLSFLDICVAAEKIPAKRTKNSWVVSAMSAK